MQRLRSPVEAQTAREPLPVEPPSSQAAIWVPSASVVGLKVAVDLPGILCQRISGEQQGVGGQGLHGQALSAQGK